MHLWHDIDPLKTKLFVRAIIEISEGSRQKYEVDPELGILTLDRTLLTPCRYPMNYGFVPQTLGLDGDALDIMVFSQEPLLPGVLVTARPIGAFDMKTNGESDYKIVSVAKQDPEFGLCKKTRDIASSKIAELHQFLVSYKALEKKTVTLGKFKPVSSAWKIIHDAIHLYQQKFRP